MYTLRLTNPDESIFYDFDWNQISVREELNVPTEGSAQISYPGARKLAQALGTEVRSIFLQGVLFWKLYQKDTLLFEGVVTGLQITGGDTGATNLNLNFCDFLGALASKYTGAFSFYQNTDSSDIIWNEINIAQTDPSGLGDLGITRGNNPVTVDRQRTSRHRSLLNLATSMSRDKVSNGYDMDIDSQRQFNIYYPFKGSERPEIIFSDFNMISWQVQTPLAAKIANRVHVLGEGQGENLVSTIVDDFGPEAADWLLWETVVQEKTTTQVEELLVRGQRHLDLFKVPTNTINLRVRDNAYPIMNYGVGDTVPVLIEELGINTLLRIRSRNFQITPEAGALIDITFEPQSAVILDDEPIS